MMPTHVFEEHMARAYAEVGLLYSQEGAKVAADYVNEYVKPLVDEFYGSEAGESQQRPK